MAAAVTSLADLLVHGRSLPSAALLDTLPEVWCTSGRLSPATVRWLRDCAAYLPRATVRTLLISAAAEARFVRLPPKTGRVLLNDLHTFLLTGGGAGMRPAPASDGAPPVGCAAPSLVAWARKEGIEDLLALPLEALASERGFLWHARAWSYMQETLGSLVCAPNAGPGGVHSYQVSSALASWVRGQLVQLARRSAACREEEEAWIRAVREATTTALAPTVIRLYERYVELRKRAPVAVFVPGGAVRVVLDPPALLLPPATGWLCGGHPVRHEVAVMLEGTGPVVTCGCSVEDQATCRTAVSAVHFALDLLQGRAPLAERQALLASLAQPAWERALAALDTALGGVTREGPLPGELGWGIDLPGDRVVPLLIEEKLRGAPRIVLYPKDELAEALRTSPAALDRNLAAVLLLDRSDAARGDSSPMARALPLLAAHPRVYTFPGKRPVRVQQEAITVSLAPRDAAVAIEATLGERPLPPRVGHATFPSGEAVVAALDEDEQVIRWAPVSRETGTVLHWLERRGGVFPREALPAIVQRLPTLARAVPMRTAEVEGIERATAEATPRVYLERLPADTLAVRARVRPHPRSPLLVPGEGAPELIEVEGERMVAFRRDLDLERESVEAFARTAGLDGAGVTEATWLVEGPEAMLDTLDAIRSIGLPVEWRNRPLRWTREATARDLSVRVGTAAKWFGIAGGVTLDGTVVPLARLLESAALGRRFVRVTDDLWVRIEAGLQERLRALGSAAGGTAKAPTLSPLHAGALTTLVEEGARVEGDAAWRGMVDRMRAAGELNPVPPSTLHATLRPYQLEGYAWMTRLVSWAGGAVLADDMGLGKTVQTLAVLLDRAEAGPALVVAPTSVGSNWVREAATFAPSLRVRLHRGLDRERSLGALGAGNVVVTSYDLLIRDLEHWTTRFATVVFDEAHALKNPDTRRARAAAAVAADVRIALTGTPLENRVGELWSLFHATLPTLLGPWEQFRSRFVLPIEGHGDTGARRVLAGMIRPFLLRRTKAVVAADLPDRVEVRVDVDLDPDARRRYEALRKATVDALNGLDPSLPPERRRFVVLAALTRLRQIACHVGLVDEAWTGGSAKLTALVELVEELRAEGRRVLVFSQFTEHLALARAALAGAGVTMRYLDGSTPAAARQVEIDAFLAGEADAFLLSIKAGGTGLNLTAASDVVLLDPWWNPAVEDQAADRAHRIGQTRKVTIYRFVARETVEEEILALHAAKRDLVAGVLDGTGGAGVIPVDELMRLIAGAGPEAGEGAAAAPRARKKRAKE